MTRRPARRIVALVAVVVATGAGPTLGCGIPTDDAPRDMTPRGLDTEAPTSTALTGGSDAYVYLSAADHLVPVQQEVGNGTVEERVAALLARQPAGGSAASQVPAGTRLLGVVRNASVVTLDLSDEFDNLQGVARRLAAAQLVMTVTESTGVEDVLFRVEGKLARVDSPVVGDTDRVRACDYVALLPTADQARRDGLDTDAVRHVARRRSSLERRCPDQDSPETTAAEPD